MENVQAVTVTPINHLADAFGIADTDVLFGANGEDGFEHAGEQTVWAWFHLAKPIMDERARMANVTYGVRR